MLKIYCYEKCSTCQKALKWLDAHGISYESHDIKNNHPDAETLRKLHTRSNIPLRKFFNTSGMLYRELGLKDKLPDMSEDEMCQILSSNGMLVKRPLVVADNFVLLGFKESEWQDRLFKN
jgi:arsenate reductase